MRQTGLLTTSIVIEPCLLGFLFFAFQMFVLVLFWFQLYNGFSGSNAIDDMSLILFNLAFTAVPPVICGILDKDVPDNILSRKPALYKSGQNSEVDHKSLANLLHLCYNSSQFSMTFVTNIGLIVTREVLKH